MEEDSKRYLELVIAHLGDISNIYCKLITTENGLRKLKTFTY